MDCLQKLYKKGKIQGFITYPIVNGKEIKKISMFTKFPEGLMLAMLLK